MTAWRFGGVTVSVGLALLLAGCTDTPVPNAAPGMSPAAQGQRVATGSRDAGSVPDSRSGEGNTAAVSPPGGADPAAPGASGASGAWGAPGVTGTDGATGADGAYGSGIAGAYGASGAHEDAGAYGAPGTGAYGAPGTGTPGAGTPGAYGGHGANGAPGNPSRSMSWPGDGWPANGWPGSRAPRPPGARTATDQPLPPHDGTDPSGSAQTAVRPPGAGWSGAHSGSGKAGRRGATIGAVGAYPVGLRVLPLRRGRHRPLTTLIFYPAASSNADRHRLAALLGKLRDRTVVRRHKGGARSSAEFTADGRIRRADSRRAYAKAGARVAAGRFPLILFSHGMSSSPERYAATLAGWASAGFVVVAPTYPYTSEFTHDYRREDVVRQPADARYVLRRAQRLDVTPGDPLRGRIDTDRMAAVGHSAGGYTTSGLFAAGHDPHLRAGVILAGWAAPGAFGGAAATMMFMQGEADPVVPMSVSRAAYDRVPWPKAYLLMRRNSHGTYLRPGDVGFPLMWSTVTDFLRWTLTGDRVARDRLPAPTAR